MPFSLQSASDAERLDRLCGLSRHIHEMTTSDLLRSGLNTGKYAKCHLQRAFSWLHLRASAKWMVISRGSHRCEPGSCIPSLANQRADYTMNYLDMYSWIFNKKSLCLILSLSLSLPPLHVRPPAHPTTTPSLSFCLPLSLLSLSLYICTYIYNVWSIHQVEGSVV